MLNTIQSGSRKFKKLYTTSIVFISSYDYMRLGNLCINWNRFNIFLYFLEEIAKKKNVFIYQIIVLPLVI